MKNKKDTYKQFGDLYDKNWKKENGENPKRSQAKNLEIVASVALIIAILSIIIICYLSRELEMEFVFCLLLLVRMIIMYLIDQRFNASKYNEMEEKRMVCAKATIKDFLGGDDVDVQKEILFIDEFNNITKKTMPYRILQIGSWIVCTVFSFLAFILDKQVEVENTDFNKSIGILLIVFAIQGLVNSDYIKNLIVGDRYYQRILKSYRERIVEEYLFK